MLKLFRRIRQQQLSENKYLKYILYAIGEIMLVVIGILIALQVNNWNENKKKEVVKLAYKQSLTEDLSNEVLKSQTAISKMEKKLNKLLLMSNRISEKPSNVDTIIKIYRYEYSNIIDPHNDINRNTLDGLMMTGNINLFDKEIYNSLIRLKDVQEKTIQTIELNLGFFVKFSTKVNLPFSDQINAFRGDPLDMIWKDIDKTEFLRDFNLVLSSHILVYKYMIYDRKRLLRETESVLELLKS